MWDYVFDWTILKYQQSGRPLPVHEVREADRAPGDARRTTADESGTSTANRPSNSMGQNLAATSRPRPARYVLCRLWAWCSVCSPRVSEEGFVSIL